MVYPADSAIHLLHNWRLDNLCSVSIQSSKDEESAVNHRMAEYQAYIEEIGEYYEETGEHINADQDIHTVFECIESIVVNPIPRKE